MNKERKKILGKINTNFKENPCDLVHLYQLEVRRHLVITNFLRPVYSSDTHTSSFCDQKKVK